MGRMRSKRKSLVKETYKNDLSIRPIRETCICEKRSLRAEWDQSSQDWKPCKSPLGHILYFLLHHMATHCNAMQRPATPCNALQRAATRCIRMGPKRRYQKTGSRAKALRGTFTISIFTPVTVAGSTRRCAMRVYFYT